MGKFHVNQQKINGEMGLLNGFAGWKITGKYIELQNSILDNLSFSKIKFYHGADFSGSSLVNTTINACHFQTFCNYSFNRCDVQHCRFMNLMGHGIFGRANRENFLEMVKKKKITFWDVKNLDQAIFEDEQVKSAIKEIFSL